MIPFPVETFVGRHQEAVFLDDLLKQKPGALVMVQGLGGVGKTTFVANYVSTRFAADKVMWISGYELQTLEPSLDKIRSITNDFANRPSLVVIDGLDEGRHEIAPEILKEIKQCIPDVPLIVTTRKTILLQPAAHLSLNGLSLQEAVEVLKQKSGKTIDPNIAAQLAQRVQNNPFALSLLGNLLEKQSPSDLMKKLDGMLFDLNSASSLSEKKVIEIVRPRLVEVSDLLVEHLKKHPHDLHKLQPRKFEELIAKLLAAQGCEVSLTKQTRDGGQDILAFLNTPVGRFLCLVEAKKYAPDRPVGVELVRTLYGIFCDHQANSALLVTTSRFTSDAREFQKRHSYQLALRDYWDVVEWIKKLSLTINWLIQKSHILKLHDEGEVLLTFKELREKLWQRLSDEPRFDDATLSTVRGLLDGSGA